MCLPAGGGRTRGAGGGWRRRGSPSRAGGEGGGVSPSRGVGRRRYRGAGWTATPPPSPLLGRPGDRGAVHGGEILKKTRDAARCRDRRSRARDERRRRPRDARARARGPRRLVRDPRRGGAARTSARRARISPARLLPSRRAARGEGGKPGGSARAGRRAPGRVRARDAPLGLLGELGLVHEVRAGQAGQILGGGHRAHGGRGGARERERCASGMWADGRATEPSSSSRTVERAPVKAFSG